MTTGTTPSRGSFAAMYEASRQASHDVAPRQLRLDQLEPNPNQPRSQFYQESLDELASSIKVHGLLQPVMVRPHPAGTAGRYEIVAGERRYQASKLAGLESIPVVIKVLDDAAAREVALIENLQREDISPLEEAHAFKVILEETGLTHRELGDRIGKTKAYVEQRVRLLRYPEEVQTALVATHEQSPAFTPGHAKAVVQVEDTALRCDLIALVQHEALSVRDTERRAHQLKRVLESELPTDRRERLAADVLRGPGVADVVFTQSLTPVERKPAQSSAGSVEMDLRALGLFALIEQARATGHWTVDSQVLRKALKADMSALDSPRG